MKNLFMATAFFATLTALAVTDPDTFAFYAFKDGAVGTSAGDVTLVNQVNASTFPGAAIVSAKAGSSMTFDSDVPGRYVYSSALGGAELLVTDPQSIYISGTDKVNGVGGTISISGANTEFSRHHDTGFTLEFYMKMSADDHFYAWTPKFVIDAGYYHTTASAYKPFNLYLPCSSDSNYRTGLGGYGSSDPMVTIADMAKLNDNEWHHFAVVEGAAAKTVSIWRDRVRIVEVAVPSTVTANAYANEVALELVRNNICGKFACIRLTKRALKPQEFLAAVPAVREPIAMSGDTLAFYPFDDLPAGRSAIGTTVLNAVDPALGVGAVSLAQATDAVALFDADAPARYVFDSGVYGSVPVYTNPASIAFGSAAGRTASVSFQGLATELARHHENGQTVEYFLKLDRFVGYVSSLEFNGGYLNSAGVVTNLVLFMPFSDGAPRQLRYAWGAYGTAGTVNQDLPYDLLSNGWHHVAAVVSADSKVSMYIDYVKRGELALGGTTNEIGLADLVLGRNAHHGKYSCLRVTKRALGTDEFLRASNFDTYWPKTMLHWKLDGADGAAVAGNVVDSAVPSFAEANTNLYFQPGDGSGTLAGSGTAAYSSDTRYPNTVIVNSDIGGTVTNAGCLRLASNPGGEEQYQFRTGPYLSSAFYDSARHASSFTAEGFFRYNTNWASSSGTFALDHARMTLMSLRRYPPGNRAWAWKLSVEFLRATTPSLQLSAYCIPSSGTDTDLVRNNSSGIACMRDGQWHHVAVTYDAAALRMVGYYDYQPVVTNQLAVPIDTTGVSALYFEVGNGPTLNDNMFDGWVDEVRYSNGVRRPEEFLRMERMRLGTFLIVR